MDPEMYVYSDASYGDCTDTSSGYVDFYGKSTVVWTLKKQQSIGPSTTESEYMVLSLARRQSICMKQLISDITNKLSTPLLLCDNQAAIQIGMNNILHQRNKHIDIHYHYVRERIMENDAEVQYVTTRKKFAVILTKPLPKGIFHLLRSKMSFIEGESFD
ncbi:hypothetical protein JTB14_002777 [Gonioctena quinquepunctata]|nr:hypothetical protein JTB14_002777 [Gonioctena quinquepunctata]